MTFVNSALQGHLDTGATTLCRCWSITRKDGVILGFTDHDQSLTIAGQNFAADAGMSAKALEQTTGLSVDNSEAIGVLSHASVKEEDLVSGRYDGAQVSVFLVNWADISQRATLFKGTLGEIQRSAGSFTAELRGLTEVLNQTQGRIYQKPCSAVFGDENCGVDTDLQSISEVAFVESVAGGKEIGVSLVTSFPERWFEKGRLDILDGMAAGLGGVIKRDRIVGSQRIVELWEKVRADLAPGDSVKLVAGCDKRFRTCASKFSNAANFRGFPHLPGDDWMMAVPRKSGTNTGGSMNS